MSEIRTALLKIVSGGKERDFDEACRILAREFNCRAIFGSNNEIGSDFGDTRVRKIDTRFPHPENRLGDSLYSFK